MNIYSIVFLLAVIFVLGCQTESAVEFNLTHNLSKYKDSSLNYEWEFNATLDRGHTYNSTYFELPTGSCVTGTHGLKGNAVSCPITFKHEEGHIWLFQKLGVNSIEELQTRIRNTSDNIPADSQTLKLCGNGSNYDFYTGSLSEGIPEYYAITKMSKNLTEPYLDSVEKAADKDCRVHKYRQGYLFVEFLENKGYNLSTIADDAGHPKQYGLYNEFLEEK